MGNSSVKCNDNLCCFYCNTIYKEPELIECSTCNNLLVSKQIERIEINNYKKRIAYIEKMCDYTITRIIRGYDSLQTLLHSTNSTITFRNGVNLTYTKPDGDINDWGRTLRLNYMNYIARFHNNLSDINYKLYEAILAKRLMTNIYSNFKRVPIEGALAPPPYEYIVNS